MLLRTPAMNEKIHGTLAKKGKEILAIESDYSANISN